MLPVGSRLKRRSDFGRTYSKGRSYVTDLVVVYVLPNRTQDTKIGFSVSKKLGGAVSRNRVRRVLQESVRQFLPSIGTGYSVIVVARVKAGRATFADITAALSAAFARTGIMHAGNL